MPDYSFSQLLYYSPFLAVCSPSLFNNDMHVCLHHCKQCFPGEQYILWEKGEGSLALLKGGRGSMLHTLLQTLLNPGQG